MDSSSSHSSSKNPQPRYYLRSTKNPSSKQLRRKEMVGKNKGSDECPPFTAEEDIALATACILVTQESLSCNQDLASDNLPHTNCSTRLEHGRDQTKAKVKRKSSTNPSNVEYAEQYNQLVEWNAEQRIRPVSRDATVRMREKELDIQLLTIQHQMDVEDDFVMMQDVHGLDDVTKQYWLARRAEVCRRHGVRDT